MSSPLARYAPQMRFMPLGETGQQRLRASHAVLCGCGALGSAIANLLVRSGVGSLRIIDRDVVQFDNLHRQSLYEESDVDAPKALVAAERLRMINSSVAIQPIVADIGPDNVEDLCRDAQVILDGLDNFETRFLVNQVAIELGIPWIYGGCVGAVGQSMTIVPSQTPCLRCLMPECPAPTDTDTNATHGILGPIVVAIAAIEAAEAMKLLSGNRASVSPFLTVLDLWQNRLRQIDVRRLRSQGGCPACRSRSA